MKTLFKTILFLLTFGVNAFCQSAPDVVVNAESPQGSTVENQNFNNLYQAQTNTQNTVTAITSALGGVYSCTAGQILYMQSTGVVGCSGYGNAGQVLTSQGNDSLPIWSIGLPSPTGYSGDFLTTNGSSVSWAPGGMTLISATPVSASSSSGNIAITQGNIYHVIVIGTNSASALTAAIRFNADSGSNYVTTASTTGTSIPLTPSQQSNLWSISFYIYPDSASIDNAWISGTGSGLTSSKAASITCAGHYSGSATITEFNIFDSQNNSAWTGNVYVYQIST